MFYINYLYTLLLVMLLIGVPGPVQKEKSPQVPHEGRSSVAGHSQSDSVVSDKKPISTDILINAMDNHLQDLENVDTKVYSTEQVVGPDNKNSMNEETGLAQALSSSRSALSNKAFDQVQAVGSAIESADSRLLEQLWISEQRAVDSLIKDQLDNLNLQILDSLNAEQTLDFEEDKDGVRIMVTHQVSSYSPGKRHTLTVRLINNTPERVRVTPEIELPANWKQQTDISALAIPARSRQWLFISFTIPDRQSPSEHTGTIRLSSPDSTVLASKAVTFDVKVYHELAVRTLRAPESAEAGEAIEILFEIANLGNVTAEVELAPEGKIEGETKRSIQVGEVITVKMVHKTSERIRLARSVSNRLRVKNTVSGKTVTGHASTKVYPTKTFKKDAFFRYRMEASLYHNTYLAKGIQFSSQFLEVRGNGYLDTASNHYLDLLVRAPNQSELSRFGINDQYSLIYSYQDKTDVFLGDHTFNLSKLGFTGRYGIGARIDQSYRNWIFTAFLSKPRHFALSKKPIYGGKILLQPSDRLRVGLSVTSSKEMVRYYNTQNVKPEGVGGQVAVLEGSYEVEKTLITTEIASSISGGKADFAADFTLNQQLGNFSYMGTFTSAGENYFGTISNSLRYSNALNFAKGKWAMSAGQNYSKVNERVDTTYIGIQPYYQNLYARVGYRFNLKNFASGRVYDRGREDLSERRSYKYREKGVEYRYQFNGNKLTANFNGRIARTSNLFQDVSNARLTYANFLSIGYRILPALSVRGSFSHNRTNRYSRVNSLVDYFQYGGGFNLRLAAGLQLRGNYNSGFSPEETFRKRDLVSLILLARIGKNHQLEARANYFMRPEATTEKELFAFVKYTFRFGVPLKKLFKLGKIKGQVYSADASIPVKGIRFLANGALVKTDAKGRFEINNIPEGRSQLVLEKNSLPSGTVAGQRSAYDLNITEGTATEVRVALARAQEVSGNLVLQGEGTSADLKGRIMLKGKRNRYYATTKEDGSFRFTRIAPGKYTLSVVTLQDSDLIAKDTLDISIAGEPLEDVALPVSRKQRKIKFKTITTKLIEE